MNLLLKYTYRDQNTKNAHNMRRNCIATSILIAIFMMASSVSVYADEIVTISASVPGAVGPGGGGGGGGGGTGFSSPTAVTFSGRAYPLSKVTILRDGNIAITTIAGPDARFSVTLENLTGGNYTFSTYTEDANGRRSASFSFPLFLTEGATTTVSGIFLAPTIDVDKAEVKQGDNINIFGTAAPSSTITISVHSPVEHFVQTQTDPNGTYLYTYDTSLLERGSHQTKSKVSLSSVASEYGTSAGFTVGDKNIPKDSICGRRGDLNKDCRVNIVDFSVLAYWYKRPNVLEGIDLNADGQITIVDFSILAYYWTG